MRILYLEHDIEQARHCHAKLLAYKGVHWELQHCCQIAEAQQALSNESIDILLIGIPSNPIISSELHALLEASHNLPRIAMVESQAETRESQWFDLGFTDCVAREQLTGDGLMRRLRLAESRQHRLSSEIHASMQRHLFCMANHESTHVAPQKTGFEAQRLTHHKPHNQALSIAILKDKGTPKLLDSQLDLSTRITIFRDLDSYLEAIQSQPTEWDCVLVEQDIYEREGEAAFRRPELRFPGPPLVLLTTDRSDASAASYVEETFDDVLPAFATTNHQLLWTLVQSTRRLESAIKQLQSAIRNAPRVAERRSQARSGSDRRVAARYLMTRPLLAIPVLPDGSPDRAGVRDAFSIDFSAGGIGFQISNHNGIPSRNWVIGVECVSEDRQYERFHFCNVLVRNVSYPQGGVRMGSQFQAPDVDLFHQDRLLPTFDAQSGKFCHSLSPRAIEQWIDMGVLEKRLMHRILACPECQGTVASGSGCRECGSPDLEFHELIHHFACAHVGKAATFGRSDELACPKCLTKRLVASSDFEVIRSHYACRDCGFEGSELANVGTCLGCHLRFPLNLAHEVEVYGYDVERLDLLALVNAAG